MNISHLRVTNSHFHLQSSSKPISKSEKVRMELRPNSGHVTFELMAFSLATSHQPQAPRNLAARNRCMVLAICHAPTLLTCIGPHSSRRRNSSSPREHKI